MKLFTWVYRHTIPRRIILTHYIDVCDSANAMKSNLEPNMRGIFQNVEKIKRLNQREETVCSLPTSFHMATRPYEGRPRSLFKGLVTRSAPTGSARKPHKELNVWTLVRFVVWFVCILASRRSEADRRRRDLQKSFVVLSNGTVWTRNVPCLTKTSLSCRPHRCRPH